MDELKEKIEHELEIFHLEMMSKSKEAIYTAADEISSRKRIYNTIRFMLNKFTPEQRQKLCVTDNIGDAIFRYIGDYKLNLCKMEKVIWQWLEKY